MKRGKCHILTSLLAGGILLAGGVTFPALGQDRASGYSYLNIPTSAHVFGLGGNNICIIDEDVTLSDQNPALIGPELDAQIEVNYMLYQATGNFAGVRFGMGMGEHDAWAIGLRYMNYGTFDGYDEFGTPTSIFKPNDVILEGTYSRDITDRWRGGANLKLTYSTYETYEAFAIAADLGVNYYDPDHDLSFSIVLRNMGGQVKRFTERYMRVPFDIQLGYMQGIGRSPFTISITANNLTRWKIPFYSYTTGEGDVMQYKDGFIQNLFRHLIFGVQYQPSDKFYACLAYNYKTASDMSSFNHSFLSGFSLGVGFRVKDFTASVAYAIPHNSGSTLLLNLAYDIRGLFHPDR